MNVMFLSLLTGGSFPLFLFINVIISIASSSANEEYYETRNRQLPRRREAYETEVPANDHYQYRENAETEFKRPGYFPVPFVVGGITSATSRHNNNANGGGGGYGDLRTMPIPSVDLSALIRQHIAHQRQKLLGSQEGQLERYTPPPTLGPLLEGVSRITELRQTPYRRFSDDLSAVAITTYAEKRRRWKAELKRRLRGPKVPARPIGDGAFSSSGNSPEESMVIRDGAADRRRVGSGTHRVGGGADHYYVTYSPQARIYQVSRRPPPNLYATDDQTPTSIGTPSPPAEEVLETGVHRGPVELQPPTASTSTTTTSTTTTTELPPFVQLEDDDTDMDVAWPSAAPTARTYLVRPPPEVTTTTAAPAIIIVQRAEPVAAPNYTRTEQIWVAPDAELTRIRFPVIKQILHLDDYYQELNDDDMEDVMDEDVMEGQNEKSGDIVTMPIMSNGDPPTTSSTTKTITTTITPTLNHIQSRVVLNEQSDEEEEDGNSESRWDQQQKQQEQRQQSAVDSRQPPIVYPGNDATPRNQYVVPTAPLPPSITTITPTSPRSREVEVVINNDDGDKEEEEDDDDDDLFFWKSERPSSRFTRRSNNTRPLASSAAWALRHIHSEKGNERTKPWFTTIIITIPQPPPPPRCQRIIRHNVIINTNFLTREYYSQSLCDRFSRRKVCSAKTAGGNFKIKFAFNFRLFLLFTYKPLRVKRLSASTTLSQLRADEMAKLERIFGSTACSSSVAVDQTTGLVAYPAGSTIVVCNPRTLSQAHLCAASATTSSNGGGGVGHNQHHQNKSNGKANQLTCLAFSPNGRYICSGEFGADPKVRVWQLRHDRQTSAQCLAELTYHRFGISCTAFTRDSAQLISVGNQHDKSVVVWDWQSGTKLAENRLTSQVNAMDVSEGGRMFVTVGVRHVKFWYLESSSGRANGVMLQGRSAILADHRNNTFVDVCCAPNNRTFAITVTKMLVEFVDKKLVNIYELGGETAYSLTLGSGRLFIGFGDSTIRAMNIDTLAVELTLRRPHRIGVDVAEVVEDRDDVSDTSAKNGFFPDVHCMTYYERAHSLTVFYADRSIYHWQFDSDGGVAKISSQMFHVGSLFDVQVVPSMSAVPQLAGNFLTAGADDTIRMWNLDLRHNSSTGTVSNNNNNNDGNGQTAWNELRKIFYVSNSNDSLCEQPDKNFGGTLSDALESTSGIRCIRLSANSMHLACGGRDGNVYIFQLDDGARLLEFEAHEAEVLCLDYSDPAKFSGRNLLASGSRDRFIHVFNADADYAHLMTVNDHSCSVSSIKFLFLEGIGGRLISCGTDKIVVVRQFDVLSEATAGGGFELCMKRLNQISDNYGVNCLCVSGALDNCSEQQPPQSRLVAACQDRHIRIFSPLNGELLTTLNGTPSGGSISDSGGSSGNGNGTLTKLCLDPSETFAATVCSDRYVYVIDLLNGDCVAALRGQADCITAIQFSADCRRLIVVSYNGCIFVWRLNANLIKRMNARLNASSATNRCITPDSVIGGGELSDSASLLNQQHHHQPTTRKSLLAVGASGGDTTGGSNASGSEFGSLTSVNIVQEDDVDSGVGGGGIAGGGCSGGNRQPQQPFKAVIQSCGAGVLEHRPFELRRVSTEVRRSTGNLHAVTADGHQQHQLEEQQAAAVDKAAMISNNGSNDHHHQQQQHVLFMEQQQHQQQQAQQQQNYYQIGGGVGEIYYPPGAVVQPPTAPHQHYYPASAASAPRGAAARLAGAINGGGGNTMLTPTTSRSMSNLSGGRGMAVSPQRAPRRRWNTPQVGQQPQPPSYDAFQQQQQKMMMGGGGGRPTANGTMNASISLNALRTAGVTTGGMPTAYGNGGVAAYAVPPQNVQQQFYGAPMPQQHFAVTRYGVGSASNLQPQNQQSILYGGGMMEGEAAGLMQMRLAASNGSTTGIRGAGGIDENFGRKSSTRNSFSKRYLRNIEEKTVWKPGSAEIRKRSTSSLFSNTPSASANVQQHGSRSRDANNNVSFAADASACDVNNNNNTNKNNNNDETESVGSAGHRRYHSASSAANGRRRRVSVTMALTDELPPNAEDGEDTVEEEESVSSASPLRRKSGRLSNVSGGNGRSTSSRILNRIRERRLSSIIVNGGGGGGAIDARPNGAAGAAWRRSGGGTQRTNANGSGIDVSPSGGVGGRTTALRSKSPTQLAMKAMAAAAIGSSAVADEEVNDDDASSLASPSSTLQRRRRTQSPSSVTAAASPSRLRQRQHENSFASTVSSPASTSRQYVALQQRRQSGGVAVTPLQARLLEARQMLKKSQENLTALAAATATTANDDASSMLRSHSIGNLKFGGGVCLNSGGDQRKLPSASNTTTSSTFNEDGADTLSGYGKRQMAKSVNSLLQTHIDDEAPRPPASKPKHFDEGGGGEMTSRLGQSIRDLRKNSNPDLTNERTYTEDEDETDQFFGGKRNNKNINNARLMDTAHNEYYSSSTLPRNLRRGVQKKLDRNITPTSRFRSRLNGGVGATTGSTNNADDSLPDDEADDDDVAEQFVQAAYHNYGGGQAGQYYATPATTSSPRSFSSLETRNAGVTSRRTFDALSHGGAASTRRTPNYLAQRFCGADFGVPDTAPSHEDLAATTAMSFVGGGKAAAHRGSTTSIDFLSSVDVETLSTQNAKKMAMHTWECIQEMTKACDKLLGARQLICGDASSVAATADHERLAMSVERVIATFRNRLDAALTADTAVSDDGNAAAAASQAEH